jgi:Ca-activated chloride channel family protein
MILTSAKMFRLLQILVMLSALGIIGCGSSGSDSTASPQLVVLPADFDFGIVTDDNSVAPLDVTIKNVGAANLFVSNIILTDSVNYDLDLNGGAIPCSSTAPLLATGGRCTVTVSFMPQSFSTFSADLNITSNDPTTPTFDMSLLGSKQNISEANVKINQIEACPRPGMATVYVSVNDQGGFPIKTLDAGDFSITEAGVDKTVTSAVSVDDTVTLSVALLMDYSFSIAQEPDNVTDMENAARSFINQLGINDEAEIIKYATNIEVTQAFTSSVAALNNAIASTPNLGGGETRLYDAIVQAVTDISIRSKDRKAIIVITDGEDNDGTGNPLSSNTLADVITGAITQGVPVFTVALGNANPTILQQLADDTGGTFSDSTTSDNLATIYQQLANLLFTDQYILTYSSTLADNVSGLLEVTATYAPTISGTDTKTILTCP